MKLLTFYLALTVPLVLLIVFAKYLPAGWFAIEIIAYMFYNIYLGHRKLKQKGYEVGFFAHLNPFSKKSQDLYQKVYFKA